MKKTDNYKVASVLELVVIAALVWWNDVLIASSDSNDISPLVLLALACGIVFQAVAFKMVKSPSWRIFIAAAIVLHLVVIPYLVFASIFLAKS